MFQKILTATDSVAIVDAPVLTAFEIARQNSGVLHVLHVLESSSANDRHWVKHFRTGENIESTCDYEQKIKEEIQKTYSDTMKSFRDFKIHVTTGYPFEEILCWAEKINADLIVTGPHSSRAQEMGVVRVKGKIGSTAEGVIMDERCPVMVVNPNISIEKLRFKKLVVGSDFSAACICAFHFALKLACSYGSKIFVYHMLPIPPSSQYTQAMYTKDADIAQKKLEALCSEIPSGIDGECTVWGGVHPHMEILKYATKKDADTIVMGSHTKEKNQKWYVGSVVERVSYRAMCPVIVITDPEIMKIPSTNDQIPNKSQ